MDRDGYVTRDDAPGLRRGSLRSSVALGKRQPEPRKPYAAGKANDEAKPAEG